MRLKCLQCGHEFEGSISKDKLGWHSSCPKCQGSFDVDIPNGRIIMAFADDVDYDNFTNDFTGENVLEYYVFDTPKEFIKNWRKKVKNPDSMWYWVLDNGDLICSGACDPNDIDIFLEYFVDLTK